MAKASAPASSANLGPGFDVLALALEPRCTVSAEPSEVWEVFGPDGLPDETLRAMVWGVAGDAVPHRVEVESEIPIAVGLGSSAAIRVAAAAALEPGDIDRDAVFRRASGAEGHPDNAAAAAFGGLVAVGPAGQVRRLALHPSLAIVLAVPEDSLATDRARQVLPETVPRGMAVRTAARLAFLIEGLRTGDADALAAAAHDELHQAPRAPLSPVTGTLMEAASRAGALHTAWSGAGPAVITITTDDRRDRVADALEGALDGRGVVSTPGIDREGVLSVG